MEVLIAFGFLGAFLLYILPSLIARKRDHKQETAIILLNLLLGWTLIGWIAALIWAVINYD